MIKKTFRLFSFFFLTILLLFFGLFIFVSCKSTKFYNTQTYRTNQKIYFKPDTVEVFLLGTVHKPTKQFNIDTLYNTLELIKPDIILYEYDSTGFDKQMNLKKYFAYILPIFLSKYQTNEGAAAKKYITLNEKVIIRPYEWSLRNKWNKEKGILKTPDKILNLLDELYKQRKLTNEQTNILTTFYDLSKQLNSYADSTIYEINSKMQDSICELRQNYQYHKIKEIIDKNDNLKDYRDFYVIYEQYWDLRNKAMAENIFNYVKQNPKKRIVVLNGYFHRYYLRKELLQKQRGLTFKLVDIHDLK